MLYPIVNLCQIKWLVFKHNTTFRLGLLKQLALRVLIAIQLGAKKGARIGEMRLA